MSKVTLQVPVAKSLKLSAEKVAFEEGFSSLQEAIRVFMAQFAKKGVTIHFSSPAEVLTSKQEAILTKKYRRARKEIRKGTGFVARSVDEMMSQLRSKPHNRS